MIHRQTKEQCWVSATGRAFFKDGKPIRLVGMVMDINDLKVAEENALQASKAKSEFLAMMSHEVRTPLNAVIGISNILTQFDVPETKRKEMYHTLYSSSDALLNLINDMLDISKIESGTFKLRNGIFSLYEVVQDVAEIARMRMQDNVQFNLNAEPVKELNFYGDKQSVRQVIMNLATNAAKFTKKGYVSIDVTLLDEYEGVVIKIEDSGIGIPEHQQESIFEKFIQSDSTSSREFEGTGLGLSIVKSLTELMDGTIQLISEAGVGSTFIVTMPLRINTTDEALIVPKDLPKELGKGKRLLLVEDQKANIVVAEAYLSNMGFSDITIADNGKQALELLMQEHDFDIVLLDMRMPNLDGYETLKRLRSYEADNDAPPATVISLTADAGTLDKEKCLSLGASDYLSKPFTPARLADILQRFVS